MKRYAKVFPDIRVILAVAITSVATAAHAQYLPVPLSAQQQTNWCWVGVSQSVLQYYGKGYAQCDIAEYTREVATWHSFGSTNCCTNAGNGCNYWNYNWGYSGSIQDILTHFDNISNYGVSRALTVAEITADLASNHVFIEHWSWSTSGGHFVIGHGISGSGSDPNIYYMNPWPGEGYHICDYNWMLAGTVSGMGNGYHTWDGTNRITYYPPVNGVPQVQNAPPDDMIYPNPTTGVVMIKNGMNDEFYVYSTTGKLVHYEVLQNANTSADLSALPKGLYVVRIVSPLGISVSKLSLQ